MASCAKTKILHVTQVGGGIQTYLDFIFNNIDRDKFELILVCPSDKASLIKMADNYNVTHYNLNLEWQISPLKDLRSIVSFAKLVKEIKPDIVHAHSSKAGMIARLASLFFRAPVAYTPNAFAYLGKQGIGRRVFTLIEKLAIPFTDVLLAASKSEAARASNDLAFPKKKIDVYPNSIEILPLEGEVEKSGKKLITTAGRLVYQKNPLMYLKVCKLVTDVRDDVLFQIVGAGFEDTLKGQIDEFIQANALENKISIIHWMDRPTLLKTIQSSDVFVMTSAFESYGYVAAEAQMLEVPVVATNVDGLNEIVENDVTGYLVESDDAKTMADKILYLLDNPDHGRSLGKNGRLRIKKLFDIKDNIKILEQFYDKFKK
jgi:glycosyltransferase involved in cell wall biosynthesis